jgi:hypothetical protein
MRRKVFLLVAVLALVACGAAYAASSSFDTVKGTIVAKANGSAKHPAGTGVTQTLNIGSNIKGQQYADPAVKIVATIGDTKYENQTQFTKCKAGSYSTCSSKSLVASGTVKSELWSGATADPCTVPLDVYYQGSGKLTFFLNFESSGAHCIGLTNSTAGLPGWTATFKNSGKSSVVTIPIPKHASTDAGGLGLNAAILSQKLSWKKTGPKGKSFVFSTGCTKDKRSFSYTVTASNRKKTTSTTYKSTSKC